MDAHGTVQGATAVITIIDDRVAWEEALRHRASHDPLTGLLTRDEAYRRLAAMLSHAPRTGVRTFLAFLDLDNMKSVNDTFGHTVGDELLRVTAQRIQTMLRDGDQIARIGGDEMLIILSGMQGTDAALTLMNQLLDATGKPHTFEGHTLYPRMSIGLAEITPGDDIEQAVHRADTAMYEAKTGGGQQVKVRLADS
jgi:diguanylate cyclase (GGDEF)-like protein